MKNLLISTLVLNACLGLELLLRIDQLAYLFMLVLLAIGVTREYATVIDLKIAGIAHNLGSYLISFFIFAHFMWSVNEYLIFGLYSICFSIIFLAGDQRFVKKIAFWIPISLLISIPIFWFNQWVWTFTESMLPPLHLTIILFHIYLLIFELVFGKAKEIESVTEA